MEKSKGSLSLAHKNAMISPLQRIHSEGDKQRDECEGKGVKDAKASLFHEDRQTQTHTHTHTLVIREYEILQKSILNVERER